MRPKLGGTARLTEVGDVARRTRRAKTPIFRVPLGLDLDEHFQRSDRDYAAYLLDMLHRHAITRRDEEDEFMQVNSTLLREFIPARKIIPIRTKLESLGAIEVNHSYQAAVRSKGYRLNTQYVRSREVECRTPSLARKIHEWRNARAARLKPVHRWLRSRFRCLEFDQDLADRIIPAMTPRTDSKLTVDEYQHLVLEGWLRLVQARRGNLSVDKYGRVHTTVTSLAKELRRCLRANGENLVGIDLKTSQPLYAGIVAKRFLASEDIRYRMLHRDFDARETPYVTQEYDAIRKEQATVATHNQSHHSYATPSHNHSGSCSSIMLCAEANQAAKQGVCGSRQVQSWPGDLDRYIRLCEEGELYDRLMEPGEDRGEFKVRIFRDVYFGKAGRWSPLMRRFEDEFPTMAEVLRALKRKGYQHSSRLMQSYESTMFIAIICERLRKEGPELPVFTIHDSILTTADHVEYVRQVIMEEFAMIGIRPTLREEHY
jgi:hypothetical protein